MKRNRYRQDWDAHQAQRMFDAERRDRLAEMTNVDRRVLKIEEQVALPSSPPPLLDILYVRSFG